TFGTLRVDGRLLLARLVAAPETSETVDRPLLIDGTAASSGGVVVEATLARALGLRVGDPVTVARAAAADGLLPTVGDAPGAPLRVAGIAIVTSQAPFPATQPGLVLIDRADLARVTAGAPTGATIALRLRDATAADHVATDLQLRHQVMTGTWLDHREATTSDVADQRVVVLTFAGLLLLTAAATAAVLTSGRAVASARESALLRAVGLTPRGAVGVLVLEHAVLAAIASLAGWLAARPLADRVVRPTVALLGAPPGGTPDAAVLLLVATSLLAGVTVATAVPVARQQRVPAVTALAGAVAGRSYGRFPYADRVERVMPLIALGLAATVARPARRLLAATSIALAVAAAVSSVGMDATLDREAAVTAAPIGFVAATAPDLLRPVAYTLMAVLAVMAAAGLVATTLTTATESRRDDALLRAAGVSGRQLVARTSYATAFVAAAATLVGLPLGVGMFRGAYAAANGSADGSVLPTAAELVAIGLATVAACTALAALVAAVANRVRPAQVLRQV
ncbi:MAG TPA: FtsX-like permease family protein, partial [Mycobacteriales bacterium]|nr:FtsX-like permease family protein [Mycobacteriales bacterium]